MKAEDASDPGPYRINDEQMRRKLRLSRRESVPGETADLAKDDESPFHCSAEWHLQRMPSKLAAAVYSWGRKLSYKSGVFSASAENVAIYFGVHRNTAQRTLEELADLGFFELMRIERFAPNVYRVIDHKEWAKKNPGGCVRKATFPWEGEGDVLGRELYAISGQRVRFLPNQVKALRKLGLSDTQIKEEFRRFLDGADYEGTRWKHAFYDFLKDLQDRSARGKEGSPTNATAGNSHGFRSTAHSA